MKGRCLANQGVCPRRLLLFSRRVEEGFGAFSEGGNGERALISGMHEERNTIAIANRAACSRVFSSSCCVVRWRTEKGGFSVKRPTRPTAGGGVFLETSGLSNDSM